jgi:hypothetical protein
VWFHRRCRHSRRRLSDQHSRSNREAGAVDFAWQQGPCRALGPARTLVTPRPWASEVGGNSQHKSKTPVNPSSLPGPGACFLGQASSWATLTRFPPSLRPLQIPSRTGWLEMCLSSVSDVAIL